MAEEIPDVAAGRGGGFDAGGGDATGAGRAGGTADIGDFETGLLLGAAGRADDADVAPDVAEFVPGAAAGRLAAADVALVATEVVALPVAVPEVTAPELAIAELADAAEEGVVAAGVAEVDDVAWAADCGVAVAEADRVALTGRAVGMAVGAEVVGAAAFAAEADERAEAVGVATAEVVGGITCGPLAEAAEPADRVAAAAGDTRAVEDDAVAVGRVPAFEGAACVWADVDVVGAGFRTAGVTDEVGVLTGADAGAEDVVSPAAAAAGGP